MATEMDLDLALLKDTKHSKIAAYFRDDLLQRHSPTAICNALLQAIADETISPYIVRLFLDVTKSIECVKICLLQEQSVSVRSSAIKQYARRFADIRTWQQAWSAIEGIPGLLQYLSTISVNDVHLFVEALGKCNNGEARVPEREAELEELLNCLLSSRFPDAKYKNPDKRPLDVASYLVPGCSSTFVQGLLAKGFDDPIYGNHKCRKSLLIKYHRDVVHDHVLETLSRRDLKLLPADVTYYLYKFTTGIASESSDWSESETVVAFNIRLIKAYIENPTLIDVVGNGYRHTAILRGGFQPDIYSRLLKTTLKHNGKPLGFHATLDLGLRMIERKIYSSKSYGHHFKGDVWNQISKRWQYNAARWQDMFVRGLELGLAGATSDIPRIFVDMIKTKQEKTKAWMLLKLLCVHIPKKPIDLEHHATLHLLPAKMKWSLKLFNRIPEEKALWLLKGLLDQNQDHDFLTVTDSSSIFAYINNRGTRNLNARLRILQLQARSKDIEEQYEGLKSALNAYEEAKLKSMNSREQSDRATYASSAALYAIASSSLDVYGSYIEWLGRFIRDPLTVKTVFSPRVLVPKEAVNLLSGIPKHIERKPDIDAISKDIKKANAVLRKLYDHREVAKKEPSYSKSDWTAIDSLLSASIQTRATRACQLQNLSLSSAEIFARIWSQTLAMYSKTGSISMSQIPYSLTDLIISQQPETLKFIIQSLLQTDDRYRAAKAEGKEAEGDSRVLVNLIYRALISLANGDKPMLAGELVAKTIIARPEASSWHRQLLSAKLLKRLPAKNAERLLLGFSEAVGEKLEEQSFVKVSEQPGGPSIIKVTTIKQLAQLLQGAEFISAEAATEVLIELFKVATHPDARLATLESLLATLERLASSTISSPVLDRPQMKDKQMQNILLALFDIIPVVASVNERRVPTEQDWLEAEKGELELPRIADNQPLWNLLIRTARNSSVLKNYFLEYLLIPIFKQSVVQHQKWLTLFLKKYQVNSLLASLPKIPLSMGMVKDLSTTSIDSPDQELIAVWSNYALLLLHQDHKLKDFCKRLAGDRQLKDKVDVKHFLAIFNRTLEHDLVLSMYNLMELLVIVPISERESSENHTTMIEYVQKSILQQLQLVLMDYDKHIDVWNRALDHLRRLEIHHSNWHERCGPVVNGTIKMIEATRTPEWKNNPERRPTILPNTFLYRLWLVQYPKSSMSEDETYAKAIKAGQEIAILLTSSHSNVLDAKIDDLLSIAQDLPASAALRIALIIGAVAYINRETEMIRVRAAIEFLHIGQTRISSDKTLRAQVKDMINTWQNSLDEGVRTLVVLTMNDTKSALWKAINQE